MKNHDITDTHLHIMRIVSKLNELDKNVSKAEIQTKILDLCVQLKQCAADEENYYNFLLQRRINYMDIDYNKKLHSKLLQSLAALREYDKVKRWDEEMQEEVAVLLKRMEQCIEKERLYYALHRKINISD